MAHDSLGEALDRLNLQPLPSNDVLDGMDDQTRHKAVEASMVTNLDDLPDWYRRKIEEWAADNAARAETNEATRHAS
jgi:hypothetical protein